jgi:bifunctional DNA-binding transcriptional regulator/antitoxin component of YhaV-PrlF toxin-antitoxin module
MQETEFTRKVDSMGRIIIPSKLRERLGIKAGIPYKFYVHSAGGEVFVGIKCKDTQTVRDYIFALERAGYEVTKKT